MWYERITQVVIRVQLRICSFSKLPPKPDLPNLGLFDEEESYQQQIQAPQTKSRKRSPVLTVVVSKISSVADPNDLLCRQENIIPNPVPTPSEAPKPASSAEVPKYWKAIYAKKHLKRRCYSDGYLVCADSGQFYTLKDSNNSMLGKLTADSSCVSCGAEFEIGPYAVTVEEELDMAPQVAMEEETPVIASNEESKQDRPLVPYHQSVPRSTSAQAAVILR